MKPNGEVRVVIETISPERAEEELTKAEGRNYRPLSSPLSSPLVEQIARAIADGKWDLNGETVKFDRDGFLIDGQHRLWGCVVAKKPIRTAVAYGVESDLHIDTGKARRFPDQLRHQGEKETMLLSACLNLIYRKKAYGGWYAGPRAAPQPYQLMAVLRDHPDVRDAIAVVRSTVPRCVGYTVLLSVFYRESRTVDTKLAEWFIEKLGTGNELAAGEPVKRLRDRMLAETASSTGRLRTEDMAPLVIKAWNLTRRSQTCNILIYRGSGPAAEPYPEIE